MVPGFLSDLINFAQAKPISFTTPGHHNGQYYDKHPAGVVFNKFFGKNLMFADTSDTVPQDRKSTRLNSSHVSISYAVFCLKKKNRTSVAIVQVLKPGYCA